MRAMTFDTSQPFFVVRHAFLDPFHIGLEHRDRNDGQQQLNTDAAQNCFD